MREDEFGLLLISVALIEDDLNCLKELVNLMKLSDAVHHQFVGYGHFHAVFSGTADHILVRANEFYDMFKTCYPKAIDTMHEICDAKQFVPESPIGVIVKRALLNLETLRLNSIPYLISAYQKWIDMKELNPLPLLLSPDNLFSEYNQEVILSPLPSYNYEVPIPTADDIEKVKNDTQQSLLYHALYHAKQRKTVLAMEEMTQCCLKLTDNEDSSCLARSAIALAQIFDLLGMKEESLLALNESINGAKGLEDKSSQACATFGHRVEFALAVGKRQGESYVGIVAKDCRSFGL